MPFASTDSYVKIGRFYSSPVVIVILVELKSSILETIWRNIPVAILFFKRTTVREIGDFGHFWCNMSNYLTNSTVFFLFRSSIELCLVSFFQGFMLLL